MALVPSDATYEHYLSDLKGYDLERYNRTAGALIGRVTAWLLAREEAVSLPYRPKQILEALPAFMSAKTAEQDEWLGGDIPSRVVIQLARDHVPGP